MDTRGVREPTLRGYQRRKTVLNLDLNNMPPGENIDQEGTSILAGYQEAQVNQQPLPMIDVDAIEDEVVESSARAFAEAKSKARRNRETNDVVIVDSAHIPNNRKRRRDPPNQTIINCDLYINLESHSSSVTENVTNQTEQYKPPPPPPEPIFTCPICMCPFTEEMSTKCGHIFCKKCIKTAIASKNKCPTCRKKVTVKELIRIFLPATQ